MINPDDLSLFLVVVGVRGSGKTELLTILQEYQLRQAALIELVRKATNNPKLYPRRKVNIFSNYPLKYFLQPEALDVDKLVTWRPEYRDAWIYFDDIAEFADKQDWQNPGAKMMNKGIRVMRHRNISLACSLNFLDDLNSKMVRQTDIIVKVRDLCFTPWGRANNLKTGEVSSTTWLDKSGVMTGYSYEESKKCFKMTFVGKKVWNHYDSFQDYDIMDMNTKYDIERRIKRIDAEGNLVDIEQEARNNATLQDIIESSMSYFQHEKPGERIPSNDFWVKAREFGLPNADDMQVRSQWGRYMALKGVKTRSYSGRARYDFEGVQVV